MNSLNDYNLAFPPNRLMNVPGINNPQIAMNQEIPTSFRGIQGLLNLFQCFLDIAYLLNLGKTVFFDYILYFIKKILTLIKYVVTLKWMVDTLKNLRKSYIYYIYQARFFKYFSFTLKLCLTFGLLSCMLLKLYKSYQLANLENQEETKEVEPENISEDSGLKKSIINNEKDSEERWKEYLKSASFFQK